MRRTRALAALFLASALVTLGGPALAGSGGAAEHKSWGKGGVSLEQYATDSAECADSAANMDLSGTAPARALALMYRLPNGQWGYRNRPFEYRALYRLPSPQVHLNRLATIMRHELERCLAGRGYVKFALTDEQRELLENLEQGSDERRAYLHDLASDPAVLAAQAVLES